MIVLDEQLLGRNVEKKIVKWYRGPVQFIIDLRPNSVIKDDAIPSLLGQQPQPTFVTMNEKDFWRKVAINNQFCVVCFAFTDSMVSEIPQILRSLLGHFEFRTKGKRMGHVIRVTSETIQYYTFKKKKVRTIRLEDK